MELANFFLLIIFIFSAREIIRSGVEAALKKSPSIISADGWIAEFKTPAGMIWRVPLIGWEVGNDKLSKMSGLVMMSPNNPALVRCADRPDFVKYVYEPGGRVHSGDVYFEEG